LQAFAPDRAGLVALAPMVTGCTEAFSPQAVVMTLSGLRGCSSVHAEVRAVLAALAPKVVGCTEAFSAHEGAAAPPAQLSPPAAQSPTAAVSA
jgi:hypothetical protein